MSKPFTNDAAESILSGAPGGSLTSALCLGGRNVALILAGVVGSVLAAGAESRSEADQSRQAFEESSANVASTLELAIQHDYDLVVDAGGLLADPHVSQIAAPRLGERARGWPSAIRRSPASASLVMVNDADLPAFAAQAEADPAGAAGRGRDLRGRPPAARGRSTAWSRPASRHPHLGQRRPPGYDYCADPASARPC